MDKKMTKETRRTEGTEMKTKERRGLKLAKWKNTMHLEVLHSSCTREQFVDTTETNEGDKIAAQRAAALQEKHAFYFA